MNSQHLHPLVKAKEVIRLYREGRIATAFALIFPPLAALTSLHEKPMPWRVRLYVLVRGVIPFSYLENFDPSPTSNGDGDFHDNDIG